MDNDVIYARYSSIGQNEQTIEGQIRECKKFAESKGFTILNTYIDRAKSGTTVEKRFDFQRMINDAEKGSFAYVIVYMFDRFARNLIDSMMFKNQLKNCGVKVISALEHIADDEGGEFYEMLLEWQGEKYSHRLSKRVKDGITTAIENGTFAGGNMIFGYTTEDTGKISKKGAIKRVVIEEDKAAIIRYIFNEYANGIPKKEIARAINQQGHRINDKPFNFRTFEKWLSNPKYMGEFSYGGRVCNNVYPPIIDKDIFDKVKERLAQNQIYSGSQTARVPYLLTGKLKCGHCGTIMIADGGTSRNGIQHNYYICKTRLLRKCDKKREKKRLLEESIMNRLLNSFVALKMLRA